MVVPALFRISSASLCLVILIACHLPCVVASEKTYIPKSKDEVDVLALIVASEVKSNGWMQNEFVCFSVNGMDPSPQLVKSFRRRKLKVRSPAEWKTKFNCGFELQFEFPQIDSSEIAKVHAKLVNLREINTGSSHLALLQKDGEYLLKKKDRKWSIVGYLSAASTSWHQIDAGPSAVLVSRDSKSFVGILRKSGLTLDESRELV